MKLISKSSVCDETKKYNGIVPFGMAVHYEKLLRGAVSIVNQNSTDVLFVIEAINNYLKNNKNIKVYICFREKGIAFFSNINEFNDIKVLLGKTINIWCFEKVSEDSGVSDNSVLVDLTEELLSKIKIEEYPDKDISECFSK